MRLGRFVFIQKDIKLLKNISLIQEDKFKIWPRKNELLWSHLPLVMVFLIVLNKFILSVAKTVKRRLFSRYKRKHTAFQNLRFNNYCKIAQFVCPKRRNSARGFFQLFIVLKILSRVQIDLIDTQTKSNGEYV